LGLSTHPNMRGKNTSVENTTGLVGMIDCHYEDGNIRRLELRHLLVGFFVPSVEYKNYLCLATLQGYIQYDCTYHILLF